jgi:MoaA/NifB/PqqE/SkfB family radical SAM enzyme
MEQVAEFGSPPPMFVLTGGDPFQRPDLFDLVRHGAALGLPVAVSPSGTPTLTAGSLAGLRDAGARAISLSLDGSTPQVHDRFRGVPGVFDATVQAWQAGSRSRAFALTGDPYAEDPWCSYQPGTFTYPAGLAAMGLRPAA